MKHLGFIVPATLVAFLLGAVLSLGIVGGFAIGRWWGEWELFYLMDVPAGGVVMSPRTGANWIKLDNNTLRFTRIPDPRQARTVKLFPLEKKETKDEKPDVPAGPVPAPGKPGK